MTKKNNNIDNLFSDKLFDYQEDVPNYVFENIQNSLNINAGKTDVDNLFSDNLEDYQEEVPDYVFENIQNKLNIKSGSTNVDVLFSDYLYNYQETTPNYVFSEIKSELKKQKAKEVSLRLQKIAASIAILLAFGIGYFSSEINDNNQKATNIFSDSIFWLKKEQVNNTKITKKEDSVNKFNKNTTKQNIDKINNPNLNNKKADFVKSKNNKGSTFLSEFKDFTNNVIATKEKKKGNSTKNNKYKSSTAKFNQLLTDSLLIADGNLYNGDFLSASKNKNKKSRWTFGTKFSPVFSFSKNNEQEEVINENENSSAKSAVAQNTPEIEFNEKPLTTFSSGLNVNFRISKRWSVQSGLFYSKRKQISENLTSSTSFYDENQMRVFTPTGDKFIDQPETMNNIKSEDIISRNRDETFYSLDMNYISNFKYIELPIIFRFKIIDKKVDLEVLSGVSTNFLVGNHASIMIDEQELWKGVNEDISPLLYDATFGFGLNYNFYNNFSFSLEPTFKYTLVKQNANIQNYPYSFAVFAGFSYTF